MSDTPTARPCRLCKQPIVAITDPPQVPPHPLRPSGVDDTRHMQCPAPPATARPELSPLLTMDERMYRERAGYQLLVRECDAQRAALAAAQAELDALKDNPPGLDGILGALADLSEEGVDLDALDKALTRAEATEAALERTQAEREALREANKRLADAAEMLWVVLANVSGGNWSHQSPEWQEAAARWRDNYYAALTAPASAAPATREGT
jgi:hypothetical protein